MHKFYSVTATALATLAFYFVSVASASFIYAPEAPEELMKK